VAEVLIIEDDDRIRPLLVRGLRECGHTVTSAPSGMAGLQLAVDSSPDLVVLDLGLPDVDGTQVLSMLRAVSAVPVIIASARADDPSLVGALDSGADDYVVKPFTSAQLDARVRAVLRRVQSGRQRPTTLTVGGLVLDLAGRRIVVTAGPTREPIDPVRVITNRSSGKMGFAVAEAARDRGAEVVLVTGPVSLRDPYGVEVRRVQTACEMYEAVKDAVVGWTPSSPPRVR